ncbi:ion transporter [Leptospira sp. 96542]|nr:ion transporter [Leptospira sp. 96542]
MNTEESNFTITFIDIFTLLISIFLICSLIIETFVKLDPEIITLLSYLDNFICIYFISDFSYNLYKSKNKLLFLKWGWIDLISSIPTLEYFRYGRIFRMLKIIKIIRAFSSLNKINRILFKNKPKGTFSSVTIFSILILIFSSISILQFEDSPDSNIKTAEDALWWSYVTMTSVGYGDKFPITSEGRIIGAILMTAGMGIFGTFTGFIASWFVEKDSNA